MAKVWILLKFGFRIKSESLDFLSRTRATGWYRDGVPLEVIAVVLGHSDIKTTRKSYASPSVEMLRAQLLDNSQNKNTLPSLSEEKPLWKDDCELARLCGIR